MFQSLGGRGVYIPSICQAPTGHMALDYMQALKPLFLKCLHFHWRVSWQRNRSHYATCYINKCTKYPRLFLPGQAQDITLHPEKVQADEVSVSLPKRKEKEEEGKRTCAQTCGEKRHISRIFVHLVHCLLHSLAYGFYHSVSIYWTDRWTQVQWCETFCYLNSYLTTIFYLSIF